MYANRGIRRLMLGMAVVLLVVLAAPVASAAPGNAKHQDYPQVFVVEGEVRYGAVEVRTGEWAGDCAPVPGKPELGCVVDQPVFGNPDWLNLMNPEFNKCTIGPRTDPATGDETPSTLTLTGKHTAVLKTFEVCANPNLPKGHEKDLKITPGGAVKMLKPEVSDETMWWKVPFLTGCEMNGTFPVYHGHFDGRDFYVSAHYNSICDGGFVWEKFGIGAEDGPIHTTYEFDLRVVD